AMPGICAYGTAKAAVISLSEHLRGELADCGVGVSVICPAFVRTNLMEGFRCTDQGQRDMVLRWMEKSGVSADDVAEQVFKAMQQRRFLVLTHAPTRWAWLLKRWWPERYYREVASQNPLLRRRTA
ncbi:MAG: SDR family NAD(P)-dependent oxidoreductase, partial [Lysobacterales bacterium]